MDTKEHAHAHLAKRLRLPTYYGNNLDALADCLGEIGAPTRITLRNVAFLKEFLGGYGDRLIGVLRDAAQNSDQITFVPRERF